MEIGKWDSGLFSGHLALGSGVEHLTITETFFLIDLPEESSSDSLMAICFAKALSSSWPDCSSKGALADRDSLVLIKEHSPLRWLHLFHQKVSLPDSIYWRFSSDLFIYRSPHLRSSLPDSILLKIFFLRISSYIARHTWGHPSGGFPRSEYRNFQGNFTSSGSFKWGLSKIWAQESSGPSTSSGLSLEESSSSDC